MIQAIIFDFDGVIAESVNIKTDAFGYLFRDRPRELVRKIQQYHLQNGGISRAEKLKYAYKHILQETLTAEKLTELCDQFRHLVIQKVIEAPFVDGAEDLLNWCLGKYPMFVVSGTPQEEMREIVNKRRLDKYFKEVYGSPLKKEEIVKGILTRHRLQAEEVLFIGDAITDLEAAKAHGISFIARVSEESGPWIQDPYIVQSFENMRGVVDCIRTLDGNPVLERKNVS